MNESSKTNGLHALLGAAVLGAAAYGAQLLAKLLQQKETHEDKPDEK